MAKLTSIPGVTKSSRELLEVAGFLDVESIAKASAEDLVGELQKANGILKIAKKTPDLATVREWIDKARDLTGMSEEEDEAAEIHSQLPVNYEGNPEVEKMLVGAPCAIPLPAKVMMEGKLAVSDIPPAILLNRYSGDLEVRVSNREPAPKAVSIAPREPQQPQETPASRNAFATGNIQRSEPESRLDIDTSRVKNFEAFTDSTPRRTAIGKSKGDNDRVALLRAPREETNRGKDPKSRWYIRGVLHTHPIRLAIGAFITLLLLLALPAAVVSAALLFVSDQFPASLPWVPKWLLVFPLAMPVLSLLYLFFGFEGKCRICGQRLFWPRNCRKNSKAHYFPGLGHIVPLCLHLLTFRWFRCTYCATPVRLKK
jgi:hypothetical protein